MLKGGDENISFSSVNTSLFSDSSQEESADVSDLAMSFMVFKIGEFLLFYLGVLLIKYLFSPQTLETEPCYSPFQTKALGLRVLR